MLRKFILKNSHRYLSRWMVIVFDLLIVVSSFIAAFLLRFNFNVADFASNWSQYFLPLVVICFTFGFLSARSYASIIRHTGIKDAYNLFKACIVASASLLLFSLIFSFNEEASTALSIPRSIIVIHFLLSLFLLISSRMAVKVMYQGFVANKTFHKRTRVLIYGAGASGLITKNTLQNETKRDYEVIGFIDDNVYKVGKSIEGLIVYGPKKVFRTSFLEKHRIDQIIISIQSNLSPRRKKQITEIALDLNLQVKMVPPIESWIHGELSAKQIKNVRIEDLLERDPIELDNININREIKDKVVMVTGAAGSIGSEISRQILHYAPKKVILLDQAESALYDLQNEIKNDWPQFFDLIFPVIASVADASRMREIFSTHKPEIIFHAAAYKHVPLMEDNPYEAIKVNVSGTKNVADLAVEYGVQKFVMVSTDKAVNPTNVMGATKRTAEIYTQSLGHKPDVNTQFIITRFGNVLGSNGSVIPLFKRQIEKGGPITITDKNITRYFMTIPEACNLVLEAGAMGNGGEIFVFDMGESVKIIDLAKKMVKLSGLKPGKDIEIVEVGLRPGEKLYEELLAIQENTVKTHHPKILIAQIAAYEFDTVKKQVERLSAGRKEKNQIELVKGLKEIVPEFISNNSVFASLDLKKIVNE